MIKYILGGSMYLEEFKTQYNKAINNKDINISLYNLIDKFNREYIKFKKEIDNLPKINDFKIRDISYDNSLLVGGYNKDNEYIKIDILLTSKEISYKVYKNNNLYLGRDALDIFKIDNNIINIYLIANKYQLLLKAYNTFKSGLLVYDGTTTLTTKIDGFILDDLKSFRVFGDTIKGYFSVNYMLGNNLKIDSHNKLVINHQKIDNNKLLDELIHSLYIDNNLLPEMLNINVRSRVLVNKL